MCNLYSMTKGQTAILNVVRATLDKTGNLPTLPGIYPDYPAPIVRQVDGERALVMARWGMPSSRKAIFDATTKRADKLRAKGKNVDFDQLLRDEPDSGTTNVRNTNSAHWKPWLTPEHRCLVPFTAFSEPGRDEAGKYQPIWFRLAGGDPEPLAFFAGIHLPGWDGVRKIKTGRENADLFAFLTTAPNAEVGTVHPKAMPVILTRPEEWEAWLKASWGEASELQRPLPDGALTLAPDREDIGVRRSYGALRQPSLPSVPTPPWRTPVGSMHRAATTTDRPATITVIASNRGLPKQAKRSL